MLRFPNAKINLGLHIIRRRPEGFHDLETVFYPVTQVRDALEIVPAGDEGGDLVLSGLPVGGDVYGNLVWRAYTMLRERYPSQVPALDIFLHKAIPMGAGLGGGSADAAFALRMINDHAGLGLDGAALEAFALELGSDCPFFIRNSPQFATGRGEIMEPVSVDLSAFRIEVVSPGVHVSTRAAFSRVAPKPSTFDLRTLGELPVKEWKSVLHNDFEESVFAQFPQIAKVKERLYAEGAIYASMSGSGSAVYGVFGR